VQEERAIVKKGYMVTTLETCPNAKNHTKAPEGYLDWHAWAEQKSKTHTTVQCPDCGKYAIWVKKPKPCLLSICKPVI